MGGKLPTTIIRVDEIMRTTIIWYPMGRWEYYGISLTWFVMNRWDEKGFSGMLPVIRPRIFLNILGFIIIINLDTAWRLRRRTHTFKKSVQRTTTRQISFMSYAMIGDFTLKPLFYGINHRGFQLVILMKINLTKYVGKDRANRNGFDQPVGE